VGRGASHKFAKNEGGRSLVFQTDVSLLGAIQWCVYVKGVLILLGVTILPT